MSDERSEKDQIDAAVRAAVPRDGTTVSQADLVDMLSSDQVSRLTARKSAEDIVAQQAKQEVAARVSELLSQGTQFALDQVRRGELKPEHWEFLRWCDLPINVGPADGAKAELTTWGAVTPAQLALWAHRRDLKTKATRESAERLMQEADKTDADTVAVGKQLPKIYKKWGIGSLRDLSYDDDDR